MKQTIRIVITITEALAALLLVAASCKKAEIEPGPTPVPVDKGADVVFRSAIGGSESGTKTAYANDHEAGSATAESIFWQAGDNVRIWCRECSAPTVEGYGSADHWADYDVTPDETSQKKGKIVTHPGTVGLRWSEAETMPVHYFYAVSPSPLSSGKAGETWDLKDSTPGSATPFTFTGVIPATQTISGELATGKDPGDETRKLTVASPDMKNLYMVSKTSVTPETETKDGEKNTVFLSFLPISTAIQFTIENAMTADGAMMQVESVKIVSDPKPESGTTPTSIAGKFEANLSGTWEKPEIQGVPAGSGIISTYVKDYPSCTEPAAATDQSSALTIDFRGTAANDPGIARGDRLQFTFFLLPTQSVDDLSFVITRKDGDGTKTIKTRLSMADGTGIPFPVHKKTYVKGILVPDSAIWTIQYSLDVNPWGDNPTDIPFFYPEGSQTTSVTPWGGEHSEGVPFSQPEGSAITTTTQWEDVPCDPGFEPHTKSGTDLSANGTANCYIVPSAGDYRFNATVRGNSSTSVGTPVSAKVLWESFGDDVTPEIGSIISSVEYDGGDVYLTTTGHDGNAVVAVTDAGNNILWSWHIWCCNGYDPVSTAQVYYNNAGTMMDRNLGATSVTPGEVHAHGLLYQWGRKDPFLSKSTLSGNEPAKSAGLLVEQTPVACSATTGTVEYTIAHPTTFITNSASDGEWLMTHNDNLWGYNKTGSTVTYSKTEYDPCPPGWRVPEGGSDGVFSKATGITGDDVYREYMNQYADETNIGMHLQGFLTDADVWYPSSTESRNYNNATLFYNSGGVIHTATPSSLYDEDARFFQVGVGVATFHGKPTSNIIGINIGASRGFGNSVRCLKEN